MTERDWSKEKREITAADLEMLRSTNVTMKELVEAVADRQRLLKEMARGR